MSNPKADTEAGAEVGTVTHTVTPKPTTEKGAVKIDGLNDLATAEPEDVSGPETESSDPLGHLVAGYPKLSGRMSHYPPMAMFRRFGALNARNLLYLQSELSDIEKKLIEVENKDRGEKQGKKFKYARNHFWLRTADVDRDGDTEQRDLIHLMRETLVEYNHAIIQQSTLLQLRRPDPYDIDHLRRFLATDTMKEGRLTGSDARTWGSFKKPDSYGKELVVLKAREGVDSFSRFLARKANDIADKFACIKPRKVDPDTGLVGIADRTIFRTTFWFTSIAAAMAPVISIVILYLVKNVWGRLGTIAAFNVTVSVLLTVMTDAKRSEVFAVTAAFAAVQVVFVGSNLDDEIKTVICQAAPS